MVILQYISILIEAIVAIFGLAMVAKKKIYGWGFFITFGIYVFYDLVKLVNWSIPVNLMYVLFFIATLSALFTVWMVYKLK